MNMYAWAMEYNKESTWHIRYKKLDIKVHNLIVGVYTKGNGVYTLLT